MALSGSSLNKPLAQKDAPNRTRHRVQFIPSKTSMRWSYGRFGVSLFLHHLNLTRILCSPCAPYPNRTCDKILTGCHNHIPDLLTLNNAEHKYTLLRNPVSRVVSAYGYRCHSPNNDCYRVRDEYCQSGQLSRKECGPSTSSKVWSFEEYLELPEYHNIFTRMFGLGSKGTFPYTADANVGQVEVSGASTSFLHLLI